MNKHVFPIKKFKMDENESFSFIRSFITFYYYIHIVKNLEKNNEIKKEFKKIYGDTKYFDFFYDSFIINKNPLIFTYFNNIPLNFYPYTSDLFYFFPVISFYNNKKHFYKFGNIYFDDKLNFKFIKQETYKFNDKEIQITIPLKYFTKKVITKNNYILLKINSDYILTKKVEFKNDNEIIIKEYCIKNSDIKKYKPTKKIISLNISDIDYISVLNKITKKLFEKVFNCDTLKKNRILYNYQTNFKKDLDGVWFTFLYPKISPFKYEKNTNIYCKRIKLIKNLKVLNLNIDIFYNNEIVKDLIKKKYKYIKSTKEYNKYENDEIYRCVNSAKNLKNRLAICNFTKKDFDFLNSDSWYKFQKNGKIRQNLGKNFLYLIIFKNKYLNSHDFYYNTFLEHYNIYSFIYNYGYHFFDNKKQFYDTELYINKNKLNINEYLKIIDNKKGYCHKMYKKSLLLAEKLIVDD
jgi:hypothetical protein